MPRRPGHRGHPGQFQVTDPRAAVYEQILTTHVLSVLASTPYDPDDYIPATALSVTVTSTNQYVVPDANLIQTKNAAAAPGCYYGKGKC